MKRLLTGIQTALSAVLLLTSGRQARAEAAREPDLGNSVVSVIAAHQSFDPVLPWQKSRPGVRHGYGIVIGQGLVITTEDIVRNHTLVELKKTLSGRKFTAAVELADEDANLALLRIADPEETGKLVPLELAANIPRDAKLKIVQFDETGKIQQREAKIVNISVDNLPQAPGNALSFKVLTDLNVNEHGAAAIHDGKIAGLIMSYNRSTRIGTLLPYPVLKHFLDDVSSSAPYKGFASSGFSWAPLVDPAKRAFLGVRESGRGVLVCSTIPGTGAAETLQSEDAILEWDGYALDDQGFYNDPDFGRLEFSYLIKGRRFPGDTVAARIIRNREPMTVKVLLTRELDSRLLVPKNTTGQQAEYLVEGGFVIRELTGDYLRAYGAGWVTIVDSRLVFLYLTRAAKPSRINDHVVILSQVLPDPINVGYQHLLNQVITHVNGEPVQNMADVFRLTERGGSVKRLRLQSIGIDIVLDQSELPAANKRLAEGYRIPQLRLVSDVYNKN